MIKKILLENFKAFAYAEIEIKPITILVGPNNGGKTTLLQSIGLIQQTLRGNAANVLAFGGLGDFDNVIHQNCTKREMRLRFDFEKDIYFDIKVGKDKDRIFVKDFSCNDGSFEFILEDIQEKKGRTKEESVYYKPNNFKLTSLKDKREYKGLYPIFYKENFFFKIRNLFESTESLEDLFKDYYKDKKLPESEREKFSSVVKFYLDLQRLLSDFYQNVKVKFDKIKYIGPIRDEPHRLYESGVSENVGFKGEYSARMIAKDAQLQKNTLNILKRLEIVNDLEVLNNPNLKNFELKFKTDITDNGVNFTDVGCGTSQILPILVQSLYSHDEMILIEQPEAHLHPKVQADIADFLVESIKLKNSFLIETHSEYLIERIRTCIMKDPKLADDVVIYYIEQNKNKKHSEITKIEIDSNGQYSALPEGYLINFKLKEMNTQMNLMIERHKKSNE